MSLIAFADSYKTNRFGCEGVEQGEGFDEIADGGMFAETGVVDENDVPVDLVFRFVELVEGEDFGDIDDFAGDAFDWGGGTPSGGEDVERLVARLDDVADGGCLGLPEAGHGEGLGVDVFEAEGFELILRPGDGVDVVVRAGETRANVVGEVAVVVVGFAVDHDFADQFADGGAGVGRDGDWGGGGCCGGLSEGARGRDGDGEESS